MACPIVYNLGIDPCNTAEDGQTRTLGRTFHVFTYTTMTVKTSFGTRIFSHDLLGSFSSLTSFAANMFTQIMQPLTMIGFGGTDTANVCSDLADQFLVETQHFDLSGLRIGFKGDTGRRFDLHRM